MAASTRLASLHSRLAMIRMVYLVLWATAVHSTFADSFGIVVTNLYSFASGTDGGSPNSLVEGSDGYFYGTTEGGGVYTNGTVFKVSANGSFNSLYSFTGETDGGLPTALVEGSDGNFYGTTQEGGTNDSGTVFKITPSGELTSLYSFGSVHDTQGVPLDGAYPIVGLVKGSDGYFYGTTLEGGTNGRGAVFRIGTNGALTVIYSCTNGTGLDSTVGVLGGDGGLYGTFRADGRNPRSLTGFGKVFKMSTGGAVSVLYAFGSNTNAQGVALDGATPNGLVQVNDGSFYGTTLRGGTNNYGTVFQIDTSGILTTLHAFGVVSNPDGQPLDGAGPNRLVQGKDGNLYGITAEGGSVGGGTFFRVGIPGAGSSKIISTAYSGNKITLTWLALVGRSYQLQFTTSLASPNWAKSGSPITATDTTMSASDTFSSDPQRFYRLALLP